MTNPYDKGPAFASAIIRSQRARPRGKQDYEAIGPAGTASLSEIKRLTGEVLTLQEFTQNFRMPARIVEE